MFVHGRRSAMSGRAVDAGVYRGRVARLACYGLHCPRPALRLRSVGARRPAKARSPAIVSYVDSWLVSRNVTPNSAVGTNQVVLR